MALTISRSSKGCCKQKGNDMVLVLRKCGDFEWKFTWAVVSFVDKKLFHLWRVRNSSNYRSKYYLWNALLAVNLLNLFLGPYSKSLLQLVFLIDNWLFEWHLFTLLAVFHWWHIQKRDILGVKSSFSLYQNIIHLF